MVARFREDRSSRSVFATCRVLKTANSTCFGVWLMRASITNDLQVFFAEREPGREQIGWLSRINSKLPMGDGGYQNLEFPTQNFCILSVEGHVFSHRSG